MKMLILRGNAGWYGGREWKHGALDEPSAFAYAKEVGFEPMPVDEPGGSYQGSPQVREALRLYRKHADVTALYGFSGGGYAIHWMLDKMSPEELKRLKLVVVLGAPIARPGYVYKGKYNGTWRLEYREDPAGPNGHMRGPSDLLEEVRSSAKKP